MTELLLFPGAGSSRDHGSLVAIEAAVGEHGVRTTRADFPYRIAGRRAPDRPAVLLQAVRDAAAPLGGGTGALVVGGRSMGGRICSLAIADAEDPMPAVGLVLICYPLHPPGKPTTLRVEHFPRLFVPCLFISGTKDAFGSPAELIRWTATIPGPVTHEWIDGRGHDLRGADQRIAELVASWISALDAGGRG